MIVEIFRVIRLKIKPLLLILSPRKRRTRKAKDTMSNVTIVIKLVIPWISAGQKAVAMKAEG
jgi:hypothetical protein